MNVLYAFRRALRFLVAGVVNLLKLALVAYCCLRAYRIRLHAVNTYGYIIHEFDPWFNYRAAEYLVANGFQRFFQWYDYMSWYPIGRPIGTTIYPGMQIAAAIIHRVMQRVPKRKLKIPKEVLSLLPEWVLTYLPYQGRKIPIGPMTVNDICCMMPAWFGAVATFLTFLLTAELSGSSGAGVAAAFVMCMIPAHMMRSAAGEFDNEAVAVSTFILVLWLWARSLRTARSWPFGVLAGLAYSFAAATWGGYIFINNLIGLHAAFLVGLGKYSTALYRAYSLYWLLGSCGAMLVPVIGLAPVRSLEQMPSLLVFLGFQVLECCDAYRRRRAKGMTAVRFCCFRICVFCCVGLVVAVTSYGLVLLGFFAPLGARIRGLFLEAVKTGNPLVDSVAEHQPTSKSAYEMYLNSPRYMAVVGILFCWHQRSPGKFLAVLYAAVAYHYSLKMSRLMIICGPIVSVLAGFPIGIVADWCIEQGLGLLAQPRPVADDTYPERSGGMGSIYRMLWRWFGKVVYPQEVRDAIAAKGAFDLRLPWVSRPVRIAVAVALVRIALKQGMPWVEDFTKHCDDIAVHMSNPQLMFQTTLQNGQSVIVDDYYKGYIWLKENTPEDSRVMAWWDYGYQITGVANRTSIADGNTWNHEHIATLGRIMTSVEKKSHSAMRHLADYVLVWAGGHGDDMAKSPHLARIGNSVFPDHCGDDDPLCHKFGFSYDGSPTPMMANSFLYKAVNHNKQPGVKVNSKFWKEVHTTKYGLMRIFKVMNVSKESKNWVADPANRVCDAPGSWYCVGQYPPALKPLIDKRRNFAQLEDFNKKGSTKSAYTKLIEQERKKG